MGFSDWAIGKIEQWEICKHCKHSDFVAACTCTYKWCACWADKQGQGTA